MLSGYLPTRLFPICNSFRCKECHWKVSQNWGSMPDYGKRYRNGSRISTDSAESAVNEIVAKRMMKKQQMRWNRYTAQQFLNVRVHVLNETLGDAFRYWHQGFRSVSSPSQITAAA